MGIVVTLPLGTEQIFLSMAFGLQGFLMLLHKKHEAVDLIAHELLGYTMVAGKCTLQAAYSCVQTACRCASAVV